MAKIRTIKPDFFTSSDVCALSPLARLLYVATWCEADREGRLVWNLRTLKIRYLPEDDCNIEELAQEILDRNLLRLYEVDGKRLAHIPTFLDHQHINPRETASRLPAPDESNQTPPEFHASVTRQARASDAQGGREGKGREDKRRVRTRERSPESVCVGQEIALLVGVEYPPSEFDALETRLADGDLTGDDALDLVRWAAGDKFWGGEVKLRPSTIFRPKHWAGLLAQAKAAESAPTHRDDEPSYYRRLL